MHEVCELAEFKFGEIIDLEKWSNIETILNCPKTTICKNKPQLPGKPPNLNKRNIRQSCKNSLYSQARKRITLLFEKILKWCCTRKD
ncbi:9139_t:CDS:2 [Diversispora eburnea]|uniref:9139_t:CDS:1 n=1 Tax=Diversispora eburnea TaxID=1213867 RepID=A0A9N9BZL1_9GLOM|nr:9139_t:CDS:2 [Diversispora eburnea]